MQNYHMSKILGKNNDPNALTEREKEILAYRQAGHSFRETCRELRVSPNEISTAEKKERGEFVPNEKANPNFENYAEMYRLFSIGKQPLQVAIELNLPVDYVSEQYLEYLKSKRLYSFVQLYQRIGDAGTRTVLLAYNSMEEVGFGNKPELVGRYVTYCQEMVNEGMNLEKMRERSSEAHKDAMTAETELEGLNKQQDTSRKALDGINKKIEESNKELARINDAIVYQMRMNPNATAAEAAREMAEAILNDHLELIRLAQEVIYKSARNNIYTRWLLLPETRPVEFDVLPKAEIERRLNYVINEVGVLFYNRVAGQVVNRIFRDKNLNMH